MDKNILKVITTNKVEIFLIVFSFVFSFWLMLSTFSYSEGTMRIATKAWSDFANHIPLIRSFSLGNNFPVEFPLFPGEPIRYHFLFYAFVGLLEKIGLRIDWALNIPSALGFFGLMMTIYYLAKSLFKSRAVGILSVIFFLFNGSFSFIEFFKTHLLSQNTIPNIITNTTFPSFGPYDGKIVSAFWNLNIYTNQRHFAIALAFLLSLLLTIVKNEQKKKSLSRKVILIFGLILGIMPFFHASIFILSGLILIVIFFLLSKQRKPIFFILLIGGILSLPRVILLKEASTFIPVFQPQYLIQESLNLKTFTYYWVMNLGLSFFLIPIGFFLANSLQKKILLVAISFFVLGHTIQLSPEIASNHKFFNAFLILGNTYTAFALVKTWSKSHFLKPIVCALFFFLIFSGIIDFFPIINDGKMILPDYSKNPDIQWILSNTQPNDVFLNSSYLYHPASLAGRNIFLGWPYFAWSLGYNSEKRGNEFKELWGESNKKRVCDMLIDKEINYIDTNKASANDPNMPSISLLYEKEFVKVYTNYYTSFHIYDVKQSCS